MHSIAKKRETMKNYRTTIFHDRKKPKYFVKIDLCNGGGGMTLTPMFTLNRLSFMG